MVMFGMLKAATLAAVDKTQQQELMAAVVPQTVRVVSIILVEDVVVK